MHPHSPTTLYRLLDTVVHENPTRTLGLVSSVSDLIKVVNSIIVHTYSGYGFWRYMANRARNLNLTAQSCSGFSIVSVGTVRQLSCRGALESSKILELRLLLLFF